MRYEEGNGRKASNVGGGHQTGLAEEKSVNEASSELTFPAFLEDRQLYQEDDR